jgi:hypothetical protein
MTLARVWPGAAILIAALGGCSPAGSKADMSGVSPPVASAVSSSVASPAAVPVVPSVPFSWDASPDTTRVPASPPDIGPSTGGPPRTDCSDATVTATGQLDHGRGAVTVTLRPGAPLCELGGVPSKVQLADHAGNLLPVRFVDPTAAITTDPPDYGYVRMGRDGPGTNEVAAVTFKLVWDSGYCGPPPVRLLLYASSWNGSSVTPVTATLANSSSPCRSQPNSADAADNAGTIVAFPARGYPLPAAAWATLRASIRVNDSASAQPDFVVRLTNPTDQAVPMRPCFSYAIGIVVHGSDGSRTGEASDGNPDCTKMPSTLPPGGSIDLPVTPTDLNPNATQDVGHGTMTWLMPGGPNVSVELP